MYTRLTRFRIHAERKAPTYTRLGINLPSGGYVDLASPANLGLGILLPTNVCRAPEYAWNSHPPPTWD